MSNVKNRRLFFIICGLIILVLLVLLIIFFSNQKSWLQADQYPAKISLSPTVASFAPQTNFSVNIMVDSAGNPTYNTDVYLKFNPAILQVQDSDAGTNGIQIQPSDLYPEIIYNATDNTLGEIKYSASVAVNATQGIITPSKVTLATITFKGIAIAQNTQVTFNYQLGSGDDTTNIISFNSRQNLLGFVSNGNYTIKVAPPSTPTNISITPAFQKITLNWGTATNGTYPVAGYAIYRATTSNGQDSTSTYNVTPGSSTSYQNTSVVNGTTYYYKIRAYDNQNPANYSEYSQEYFATPVSATVNYQIFLAGRTNYATSDAVLEVFNAGTTSVVFSSNVSTDSSGNGSVILTGISAGNYDFSIKPNYNLSKKVFNIPLVASSINIEFGTITAGNLNNDPTINGFDFAIIKKKWFTSDVVADINADGIVNGLDLAILTKNWFKTDE